MNSTISPDTPLEQYSLEQSIVLHLLPGAIATVVYVLTMPFFTARNYPSITALYLPMILAVILVELGYLFYQGQKKNGSLSLKGVVNYRQHVPWWMYIAFPLLILIWGILITALVSPVDNLLLHQVFKWLPDWYTLRNVLDIKTVCRQNIWDRGSRLLRCGFPVSQIILRTVVSSATAFAAGFVS